MFHILDYAGMVVVEFVVSFVIRLKLITTILAVAKHIVCVSIAADGFQSVTVYRRDIALHFVPMHSKLLQLLNIVRLLQFIRLQR